MVKKKFKVVWNDDAKYALKNIYHYIKERESIERAKKVRNEIAASAKSLNVFPEKFVEDPYLKEEPGNFRFKVIWSYKIIYEVTSEAIMVLDIFHTSRNPDRISANK
ncbi:type II toxin-antitoxin system RelE/ParE family toxin [Reichenbachiella carrageenanivorans]|uniref:Type II toxin-antitoxin system RelE/ParE family toxin n=1 Tax=Reichenbachiella carrageenanivorans TaxID=2979869 RepID=A0ABY6D350_9BACT|nr:type II toxin-antitoxin system RelE/ParE family toxin [Reichenbachiella carrageenanivorans]UXX80055.1 type II toxin-antitoxin system RelE/ParE family toxin [Reichenbachiella carrageenanivorans]